MSPLSVEIEALKHLTGKLDPTADTACNVFASHLAVPHPLKVGLLSHFSLLVRVFKVNGGVIMHI